MSRPPHVYLSTACMHEEHDRCRKTCKFCPSKCVCPCHPWVSPGADAPGAATQERREDG